MKNPKKIQNTATKINKQYLSWCARFINVVASWTTSHTTFNCCLMQLLMLHLLLVLLLCSRPRGASASTHATAHSVAMTPAALTPAEVLLLLDVLRSDVPGVPPALVSGQVAHAHAPSHSVALPLSPLIQACGVQSADGGHEAAEAHVRRPGCMSLLCTSCRLLEGFTPIGRRDKSPGSMVRTSRSSGSRAVPVLPIQVL